jgi:hypothetical protein
MAPLIVNLGTGCNCSASGVGHFNSRRASDTHEIYCCVGPGTNLVAFEVEKNHFHLPGIEPCFLGRSACNLSHYPD